MKYPISPVKHTANPQAPLHDFSARGALRCAELGRLEAWIRVYLDASGDFHIDLDTADDFHKQLGDFHKRLAGWFGRAERFWVGPVEMPLSRLIRRYGPEEAMPWKEPRERWERRVAAIQNAFADPSEMPPMIARAVREEPGDETSAFRLLLNDGAHRHEALKRLGETTFWVCIWFDSAALQREFIVDHASISTIHTSPGGHRARR